MMVSKSHRKPLVGEGLLARAECFLRREKARKKWHESEKWRRWGILRSVPCRVQTQTPLNEAKLAKNCACLVAYLKKVGKAKQKACATAIGLSKVAWTNFLTEATWRLPLWEDDNGMIGLCSIDKVGKNR